MCVSQLYVDAKHTQLKLSIEMLIGTKPLHESLRNLPALQSNALVTTKSPSTPNNFNLRMFLLLSCLLLTSFYVSGIIIIRNECH